jgi:hypothetical protein
LKGILSSKLVVFSNKEAFERMEKPLEPDDDIENHGTKKTGCALFVKMWFHKGKG